jgi:hypothetical protein
MRWSAIPWANRLPSTKPSVLRQVLILVAFMLADMAIGVEAARNLVWKCSQLRDMKMSNTYYASIAKAYAGEVANKNAADAVQVPSSIVLMVDFRRQWV